MKKPYDIFAARFDELADFLDVLPPGRFDFAVFVGKDWKGAQDLSCGAPACGLGWAAARFVAQCDVVLQRVSKYAVVPVPAKHVHDVDALTATDFAHKAAKLMFDIDSEADFERLFVPWSPLEGLQRSMRRPDTRLSRYATAKELAQHIRTFVQERYEPKAAPDGPDA